MNPTLHARGRAKHAIPPFLSFCLTYVHHYPTQKLVIGQLIEEKKKDAEGKEEADHVSASLPSKPKQHDMGPPPPRIKLAEVKSLLESREGDEGS